MCALVFASSGDPGTPLTAGFPYTRGMSPPAEIPLTIAETIAEPDHWANLLWAVSSTDICTPSALPWLPAPRRQRLHEYFSTAEVRAALLETLTQKLESTSSRRLGIYFENLWAFAFEHHPDYRLIARNFPIREDGRTLGELDFLVEHLPDGRSEHWEVAVKFYLRAGDYWVGPGLKDRLDIKLARMRTHQLPVLHTAATSEALTTLGLPDQPASIRQWALMPGRLFRPLGEIASQQGTAPDCWWCTLEQFIHSARYFSSGHWFHLPKRSWLAPVTTGQPSTEREQKVVDERLLARGPVCVAGTHDGREYTRGFIVPDDWLEHAIEQFPPAP